MCQIINGNKKKIRKNLKNVNNHSDKSKYDSSKMN